MGTHQRQDPAPPGRPGSNRGQRTATPLGTGTTPALIGALGAMNRCTPALHETHALHSLVSRKTTRPDRSSIFQARRTTARPARTSPTAPTLRPPGERCKNKVWGKEGLMPGLSGAGPRPSECKQKAPSRVHSRPFVGRLAHNLTSSSRSLRAIGRTSSKCSTVSLAMPMVSRAVRKRNSQSSCSERLPARIR